VPREMYTARSVPMAGMVQGMRAWKKKKAPPFIPGGFLAPSARTDKTPALLGSS